MYMRQTSIKAKCKREIWIHRKERQYNILLGVHLKSMGYMAHSTLTTIRL